MTLTTEKRPAGRRPALPKRPRKPATSVPRSTTERMWLIGGGTVALLLTVVAYFFFISPQRSETSDVQGRIDAARTQNGVLQHRIDQLRQQSQNLGKYQAERDAAEQALPSTSGLSDFLRSLQALGAQTQTNVIALTVGQPTNANAAAAPAPANASATPGTAPAAGADSAGTAPAASGSTAPAGPVVFALPINAQVSGPPANLNRFLDQLQNVQPRAVLITSLVETAGQGPAGAGAPAGGAASPGGTMLQLTLQAFVAPSSPTEQASLSAAAH